MAKRTPKTNATTTTNTPAQPRTRASRKAGSQESKNVVDFPVSSAVDSDITASATDTAEPATDTTAIEPTGEKTMSTIATLTLKKVRKNGNALYTAQGLRGGVLLTKTMFPAGVAPASIDIDASVLAQPDAKAAEKSAKKAERLAKSAETAAVRASKLQERIDKQNAAAAKNAERLAKLQAKLAKGQVTQQEVTEEAADAATGSVTAEPEEVAAE